MIFVDAIFANLDCYMRKEGITKKRLAFLFGVNYSRLLRWWKRKDMPVVIFLDVLAALGVEPKTILTPHP